MYSLGNLFALNFTGFVCISVVVFLSSTQPFYLSQVFDLDKQRIGTTIGNLGFLDEIVTMAASPLLGILCDRLNANPNLIISGQLLVQVAGFALLAGSMFCYALDSTISMVYYSRIVFAIGVSACMGMIPVGLAEAGRVGVRWNRESPSPEMAALVARPRDYSQDGNHKGPDVERKFAANGKLSALIGISTGIGAIFAVSAFLPLPVYISEHFDLHMRPAVRWSFVVVGAYLVVCLPLFAKFAYKKSGTAAIRMGNYWSEFQKSLSIVKEDSTIQLSLLGSFVARSTTVATSVFIPLMVYKFYEAQGKCSDGYGKDDCHEGYVFASILTGVAQTVALVCAPFWGWLADLRNVGKVRSALLAAIFGVIGNYGLCLAASGSLVYNPKSFSCFATVCTIGFSQIGSIITSMSLLSAAKAEHSMGSLSGLYSFAGGFGILIISKIGGSWSDSWVGGPFFILGTFNLVMVVYGGVVKATL